MDFKNKFLLFILITVMLQACKKDLTYLPKDELTVPTVFVDNNGFKTYTWQFYNVFPAYSEGILNNENNSDLFENANPNGQSAWAFQLVTIPSSSGDYNGPYSRIRSINLMLDNIDGSKLGDADKNHWRSVGYFFRAYNYMDLLNKYGDVPLILNAISESDPELYKPRNPRDEVAAQILSDLSYAEANIKAAGDGPNTINTNVVRALISRFGLREGTWRKYHGLANADQYLRASVTASEKLMTALPTLAGNYDLEFNSNSLAGMPGIILYKQYETAQLVHVMSSRTRQSAGRWDLTKKAADMYLMTDGQTRFTSPLFQGDQSPYTEFRSRDKRLYYTVPPPFKVNVSGQSWTHTGVAADREYIDTMAKISDDAHKTFPTNNWAGIPVKREPHFVDDAQGQAFCVTYTGYRLYKFSNKIITGVQNQDVSDCPIFRMGEVLVNYAEAKFELGELDQTIVNNTINKLRARGGVANLTLAAIPIDPTRGGAVDPLLWEIRRERAIELMGEGFRFDDLRRWKKLEYITERKIGRWIKKGVDVAANAPIPILGGGTEGYIAYEQVPPSSMPGYYYLYPIPSDQIVLTKEAIKQNPGWK